MDTPEFSPGSLPPSIPPTMPGPLPAPGVRTTWPTVIGVIAIILGVFGTLGNVWGIVAASFMPQMMSSAPPDVVDQMKQMQGMTVKISMLSLPIPILLLAAGIGLVNRRRWGVSLAKGWAVLKMLLVVVSMGLTWHMQDAMFTNATATSGMPANAAGVFGIIKVFSVIFTLAWGWAFPVFLLIWMARARIKAEVASWR